MDSGHRSAARDTEASGAIASNRVHIGSLHNDGSSRLQVLCGLHHTVLAYTRPTDFSAAER
jgi:hypothetical protein